MHTAKRSCKTALNRPCKDIQLWPFNSQALAGSAVLFLLLGRVLWWHLGASSSPSPPCTQCPGKGFQKWLTSLRCIRSGIFTAQFSQLTSEKSARHPCPFPRTPQPWSLRIFSFSASTLPNYSWPLVHHSTKTGSKKSRHSAWDHCRRQNATAAAPFLHRCTSAFDNPKLFTHQNSPKPVHSH